MIATKQMTMLCWQLHVNDKFAALPSLPGITDKSWCIVTMTPQYVLIIKEMYVICVNSDTGTS